MTTMVIVIVIDIVIVINHGHISFESKSTI